MAVWHTKEPGAHGCYIYLDPETAPLTEVGESEFYDFMKLEKPFAILYTPFDVRPAHVDWPCCNVSEYRFMRRYLYKVEASDGRMTYFSRVSRPIFSFFEVQ